MNIIVVAGRKGGCGKTTGATNLAVWFASQGWSVAMLDTDPERQAQMWHNLRLASDIAPKIHLEHVTGDVRRSILSISQEFDWVIVDTPGLDSLETKRAIAVATIAVFPFKTSIFDLKTLALANMLAEEIKTFRPDAVALAYASETDTGQSGKADRASAKETLVECKSLTLLEGFTAGRKAYRHCVNAGMGITEWSDIKAAAEFDALATEICSYGN
mgnify:CR=1 FL=1|tara:strand:- start:5885 stop:6532 length:648 start_codon:yes stop_codon:yes gene_type:complete